MGSRIKQNPETTFEVYVEVTCPSAAGTATFDRDVQGLGLELLDHGGSWVGFSFPGVLQAQVEAAKCLGC
ncbi:putative DENN domain-containing protein [Naja naja]|nr:putative DENN domain-containing protein [Naja naja]